MSRESSSDGIDRIVVIGASADGIAAISTILAALPAGFPAPVLVVLHLAESSPGILPMILRRRTRMKVTAGTDGAPLLPGTVYVASPRMHMTVEPGRLRLLGGPRQNFARPSIDALFSSAASVYGASVIGVILTGYGDDGAEGLHAIKSAGGTTIVEDPASAGVPRLPESARARVAVDHCLPSDEIGPLLVELVAADPPGARDEVAFDLHALRT